MSGVAVQALGCRVNRADLDATATELLSCGLTLVDPATADAILINTCAVTAEAEAKCRQAVRRALGLPTHPWVVVSGCAARLFADELAALGERVVVVKDRSRIVTTLCELLDTSPDMSAPVVSRLTPTGRSRPLVKIQDGCDLRCSYCIVWKARGASRSRNPEEIIQEVKLAIQRGAGEVVLTGINIGCYAYESEGTTLRLAGLLELLLEQTTIGRLRVSSIEPQDVTEDLVRVIASSKGRVAPFLHMCLQSGSNTVLKRMRRIYTAEDCAARVKLARTAIPNMTISTDIIVGFPGETDEEFEATYALAEELKLSWLHVFRYSPRPGTPAADMEQVESNVVAARATRLRELAQRLRTQEAERCVGRHELVLAQGTHPGVSGGLLDVILDGDAPEGTLVEALITKAHADGKLEAHIISSAQTLS